MQAVLQGYGRSPRTLLASAFALAAAVLSLAAPRSATAGQYTISACQADEAGYASGAFENFATRGMRWRRACNPLGPGLRGLVTANVPGTGHVAEGAQSAFILNAPSGTTFSSFRWSGYAQRRDCRYAIQLFAERPGTSPVAIRNIRANRKCPGSGAQASSWPRPRTYGLGAATRIVQRVVCVGAPSREFCSARGQNYIRTFAAEATVVDGIAPSAAIVQDNPFTRSEWVSGVQTFAYEASDNVGVRSAQDILAGASREVDTRSCDYSQRIPCPNGRGELEVNTRQAPEGSQPLAVSAEDAAGNVANSSPVTVRIDNAAPGAVPVSVVGGEAWRNSDDFDIAWTNPAEVDRAPISAAHYRICRAGNGECVGGDRSGEGTSSVENLAVPSPGDWELRLWRQDAAGNQEPDNASLPVHLRFDPDPPQLGFEGATSDDPTRVSVLVTDPISGLGGGGIEMSRVGSGVWQVLPTSQEGEHLVTKIDDAAQPPGEYELRATAHDQANNLASTDRRLDGQPMRVTLPLRIATSIKAGVVGKRTVTRIVHRHGKTRKVRRTITVLQHRSEVPFGKRVRLSGRLVNRAGHPIADARLVVYSRVADGNEGMDGTVTTNADGRFVYPIEARSSRTFRFVYQGTATILPVEDTATLLVKARSSISVKPKHVLNGDSVVFTGRVRGRPLPEAGKLIELQVLLSSKWQTFRTLRTGPDGRWRIRYLFDRTCGVQRFPFRAHVTGEAPFPLEPGNSPTLTVRVRGRPCVTG
jgi:hypothetical protein